MVINLSFRCNSWKKLKYSRNNKSKRWRNGIYINKQPISNTNSRKGVIKIEEIALNKEEINKKITEFTLYYSEYGAEIAMNH